MWIFLSILIIVLLGGLILDQLIAKGLNDKK